MKTTILATFLALSMFATACSSKKKGNPESCEDVYEHTLSLVPSELKSKVEGDKEKAIAKCEKMSVESRQCALDASSMEDLMKCPRK
ncbi:MAG: hypothetical protein KF773_02135 [Deltaproteobacteria bacterium]|nr:hypothetical protein [Deltaproteobacteria bacterium]MCW5806936.1 hypothetical protein [Deltaproteobacteria bacterium]